jgi:hypothetical protein
VRQLEEYRSSAAPSALREEEYREFAMHLLELAMYWLFIG